AIWLKCCGFDRATIARVVYERASGLRRATKAEAIARISEAREHELYLEYRRKGVPERRISALVLRKLRGSEPRATASVRMAEHRYLEGLEHLNQSLAVPIQSDPLSHALTILFRDLPITDAAVMRRHADAVHTALMGATKGPDGTLVAPPHAVAEAILAGRWGLVRLFPWTTIPETAEAIKQIRTHTVSASSGQDGVTLPAYG